MEVSQALNRKSTKLPEDSFYEPHNTESLGIFISGKLSFFALNDGRWQTDGSSKRLSGKYPDRQFLVAPFQMFVCNNTSGASARIHKKKHWTHKDEWRNSPSSVSPDLTFKVCLNLDQLVLMVGQTCFWIYSWIQGIGQSPLSWRWVIHPRGFIASDD